MKIGHLYHRVELQKPMVIPEDSGGYHEQWETEATVWAERLDLRGREYFAAQSEQETRDIIYRIRWRSDIERNWRIVEDGRAAEIISIADVGRHEALEIIARWFSAII